MVKIIFKQKPLYEIRKENIGVYVMSKRLPKDDEFFSYKIEIYEDNKGKTHKETVVYRKVISGQEAMSLFKKVAPIYNEHLERKIHSKRIAEAANEWTENNNRYVDKHDFPIDQEEIRRLASNYEELIQLAHPDKTDAAATKKQYYEKRYAELAAELRRFPTMVDLAEVNITREMFRQTHGTIKRLAQKSLHSHPSYFTALFEFSSLLNPDLIDWVQSVIERENIFTITTITHAAASKEMLDTLMNFHAIEGGMPIFIPMCKRIEDIDPAIINLYLEKKAILITQDLAINDNLVIRYINQNEKTLDPTSGFNNDNRGKTIILGGIQQIFHPRTNKKRGHATYVVSPGTISANSHRASINHNLNGKTSRAEKAKNTHFPGAVLIEKVNEKIFIPTQIQFMPNGEFTVYGRKYKRNALVYNSPNNNILGDLHEKEHAEDIVNHTLAVHSKLEIPEITYHDILDFSCGSHWNEGRYMFKAFMALTKKLSWAKELKSLANFLRKSIEISGAKKTNIVASNHNNMLDRAMDSGLVFKDAENAFLGFLLAPSAILSYHDIPEKSMDEAVEHFELDPDYMKENYKFLKMDSQSLLKKAVSLFGFKDHHKVNWLSLDDSYIVDGFENGEHGDKGSHGAKGSFKSFYNNYEKIIHGHTHVPVQYNHYMVVGHNIDMRKGKRPAYQIGGTSAWLNADAYTYKEGTAHHVYTIMGVRSRFLSSEYLANTKSKKMGRVEKFSYPDLWGKLGKRALTNNSNLANVA